MLLISKRRRRRGRRRIKLRSLAVGVWPGSPNLDGKEGSGSRVELGIHLGSTDAHTRLVRGPVRRRGLMEGTETATEGINKGVKYGDRRKLGVKIKAEEAEGWRTG